MRLWIIVEAILAATGLKISPGCEQLLRSFVETGETALATRPEGRPAAATALARFLADMVNEALRSHDDTLHEPYFHSEFAKFCPFYPFC